MNTVNQTGMIPWCGPAPDPAALLGSWNLDPLLLLGLLAVLGFGLARAAKKGVFLLAWLALVIAFVSPLCALTTALFSARALHHLLLVSFAAPLLALSLPASGPFRPSPTPVIALIASAIALILWHIPAVYSAAWNSVLLYWLMQFALLAPAWAFWSGVFRPQERDAGTVLVDAVLVGAFAAVMGFIGAVLTFSNQLLYDEHIAGTLAWGMDPLRDQQAAGLIMWVPGLIPVALIAAIMGRRAWRLGEAP